MLTDSAKNENIKYKYPLVDKLFDGRLTSSFCWFIILDESLSMTGHPEDSVLGVALTSARGWETLIPWSRPTNPASWHALTIWNWFLWQTSRQSRHFLPVSWSSFVEHLSKECWDQPGGQRSGVYSFPLSGEMRLMWWRQWMSSPAPGTDRRPE